MGPAAAILPCGTRLHLQHGPIDLIIGADGDRAVAFDAAKARFTSILNELVAELPLLKGQHSPDSPIATGAIAQRMQNATRPHCHRFITPMAAVAGAVADTVLKAMTQATPLRRAYVNNGGDIALHLTDGDTYNLAMAGLDGHDLGRIHITANIGICGLATSGRHGRSLSRGIADSVTVLAKNAACADAAATLIGNAVDLPTHLGIDRRPACDLHPDSDLGQRLVTTHCPDLSFADITKALHHGRQCADTMIAAGQIHSAALFLQGHSQYCGPLGALLSDNKETARHA